MGGGNDKMAMATAAHLQVGKAPWAGLEEASRPLNVRDAALVELWCRLRRDALSPYSSPEVREEDDGGLDEAWI